MVLYNNLPAIIAAKEAAEERKFRPTQAQLRAAQINNKRWGALKAGAANMTLDEANKLALILKVDVQTIIGKPHEYDL